MSRRCARCSGWASRLEQAGRFGELERLILELGFGEYLARIAGGMPMSQGEIVRLAALGLDQGAIDAFAADPAVRRADRRGRHRRPARRARRA